MPMVRGWCRSLATSQPSVIVIGDYDRYCITMEFNVELGIAKWIFKCLPKVRAAPGGTESGLRSVEIGTPYGTSFRLSVRHPYCPWCIGPLQDLIRHALCPSNRSNPSFLLARLLTIDRVKS